jgi:hypothetical protein
MLPCQAFLFLAHQLHALGLFFKTLMLLCIPSVPDW